jgi:hypothetical protein
MAGKVGKPVKRWVEKFLTIFHYFCGYSRKIFSNAQITRVDILYFSRGFQ